MTLIAIKFHVRRARKADMDWINNCYDEAEFIHSVLDKEVIALAEHEGERAGLGRLVTIDGKTLELGGMYVLPSFRNLGIAHEILSFLLPIATKARQVFCIPFAHLVPFYMRYGFVPCEHSEEVPEAIVKKHLWCQKMYANPTSLLIMHR